MIFVRTFRSGFAISGRMLQNGLITSKNFTEIQTKRKYFLLKIVAFYGNLQRWLDGFYFRIFQRIPSTLQVIMFPRKSIEIFDSCKFYECRICRIDFSGGEYEFYSWTVLCIRKQC